jgi:hypothetical protein
MEIKIIMEDNRIPSAVKNKNVRAVPIISWKEAGGRTPTFTILFNLNLLE